MRKYAHLFGLLFACLLLAAPGSCQNGPTASQTFHYGVTAQTANGESAFSNDVSVTIPNDGATHTVTLNFAQSTTVGITKNCWYRSTATSANYVIPGSCSTAPVTTFVDNTLASVAPPKPPTLLSSALAQSSTTDNPIIAVFKSKDGNLIATVRRHR